MKKVVKIIIFVLSIIILCLIVDLTCIFTIHRPIFAIPVRQPYTYTGIFYNTYNCPEYPIPQIKSKGTKVACGITRTEFGKVLEIVDTTKDIKNFTCDEALEGFYEDDKYNYFYSCMKGKYMIVRYESGYEETIEEALRYGSITINDLEEYDISYIKYEK